MCGQQQQVDGRVGVEAVDDALALPGRHRCVQPEPADVGPERTAAQEMDDQLKKYY